MRKNSILIIVIVAGIILSIQTCGSQKEKNTSPVTKEDLAHAENVTGLQFTDQERDTMLPDVQSLKENYIALREHRLANATRPALVFNPLPYGFSVPKKSGEPQWDLAGEVALPDDNAAIAFLPVHKLAVLIQSGKITSEKLTRIYLERLKKYGDTLQCVVSITEERALQQARRADRQIAAGNYRGPLHGIPYGVKDLLSAEGYKTTWGAAPYKEQQFENTATVVKRLDSAGAVLVAKLTLGALAMGDVWYDGVTKNPWNLKQGSSGSSAGPASATAAGLVPFAIGSETYGSIVSPSTRCGVSGLRPTFGRVSRHGAMALSWSMDKIGPLSRSAKDNAIILEAIGGKDPNDPTTLDAAFQPDFSRDVKSLKVAYLQPFFEQDYRSKTNDSIMLKKIRALGITPQAVTFPEGMPVESMLIILDAEAAAAFDELTRSNDDDLMAAQHRYAWPNIFRYSRFIPAVEYIQANRLRTQLIEQIHEFMSAYDVVITPSYGGNQLLATNLTGHPCAVIPNGFDEKGHPTSISFLGNLYDEARLVEFTHFIQENTKWDNMHPPTFR
jgi:Asp-tRNA(Asn)/Glu-tRNA(Gln) amidotransferase A subunit family amidase